MGDGQEEYQWCSNVGLHVNIGAEKRRVGFARVRVARRTAHRDCHLPHGL